MSGAIHLQSAVPGDDIELTDFQTIYYCRRMPETRCKVIPCDVSIIAQTNQSATC